MSFDNAILKIPEHPFFVGMIDPEDVSDLPTRLPFALDVHPKYCIPTLLMSDEISSALEKAYSAGSMISTPLGESELSSTRMNEVLDKISSLFPGSLKGKSFLEIGCGNGELLNQLKLKGADVVGLEIGPQARVVEERYGIQVIKQPLSLGAWNGKFDCIYSYGCLEHIENLNEFFMASKSYLNEGGLFFHSVPNAALSFKDVQIDHLLHEHVNYFTPENGVALFNAQGFCSASSSLTRAGNEVMIWGFYEPNHITRWPIERVSAEKEALQDYADKLTCKVNGVLSSLREMIDSGLSIGFYAGGYEYGVMLKVDDIRYFDGDIYKHGKQWLSGLPLIESPALLVSSPVDRLIVCKPHYFDDIKRSLMEIGYDPKRIVNIAELGGT